MLLLLEHNPRFENIWYREFPKKSFSIRRNYKVFIDPCYNPNNPPISVEEFMKYCRVIEK